MKKILILFLVLMAGFSGIYAQDLRDTVEKGIKQSNSLVDNHNWNEGFAILRSLDSKIGAEHPELHYLVSKQRFTLYRRLNKKAETQNQLDIMEKYAKTASDKAVVEDLLLSKASFYTSTGNHQAGLDCYKELFQRRAKGADVKTTEKCFKDLMAEAKQSGNQGMGDMISQMYTAWQDSIAKVKAAQELKNLQDQYTQLQEESDSKQSKINGQWATIALFAVVSCALGAALAFFILMLIRNKRITSRLRADLRMSNSNNDQKSLFISNISQQMSPSLNQIALGKTEHIGALRTMLNHIERYMNVENLTAEQLETTDTNVAQFCEEVVAHAHVHVPISVDAQKLTFPIAKDVMMELLTILLQESCIHYNTERITLSFKKRNPHTGQFHISVVGFKLTDEEKETIFTAFARVYDLSMTDGLSFPTCALMAHKMGGQLTLDPEFSKGTRFVVDVHC